MVGELSAGGVVALFCCRDWREPTASPFVPICVQAGRDPARRDDPRERPTALTTLGKTISGSPGHDPEMRGTIAYDETPTSTSAAEFNGREAGAHRQAACDAEDHASLLLAFPAAVPEAIAARSQPVPRRPGQGAPAA